MLGLTNNAYVTVDNLWTGRALRQVTIDRNRAGVGVECEVAATERLLRIGPGQFVPATAVSTAGPAPSCA